MSQNLIYLSHAGSDWDPYLDKFASDLSEELRIRTGARDWIAFSDRGLRGGEGWSAHLAKELAFSRAFVPILSPAYFASPMCGKEWEFFDQRLMAHTPRARARFPVLWIAGSPLPPVMSPIQIQQAEYPASYQKEGLLYVLRLQRLEEDYNRFLEAFVRELLDGVYDNPLPAAIPPPSLDVIPNAFEAALKPPPLPAPLGPRVVRLGLVGEGKVLDRARLCVQMACAEAGLLVSLMSVDPDLVGRIRQAEEVSNAVLLLVDPRAMLVASHRRAMTDYARHRFLNSAVVVVWDEETGKDRALQRVVGDTVHATDVSSVNSLEELEVKVRRVLRKLVARIIQAAAVRRPLDRLPHVSLPRIG